MSHTRSPRPDRRVGSDRGRRDRGAALIMAIGFVVMIGTIVAGLTAMVTSGLQTRVALEEIRDRQYAADGAIEQAIADARSHPGPIACDTQGSTTSATNGIDIRVDRFANCGAVVGTDGLPVSQLTAVFSACPDTGTTCADDDVVVRAMVGFDVAYDGTVTAATIHSWNILR